MMTRHVVSLSLLLPVLGSELGVCSRIVAAARSDTSGQRRPEVPNWSLEAGEDGPVKWSWRTAASRA